MPIHIKTKKGVEVNLHKIPPLPKVSVAITGNSFKRGGKVLWDKVKQEFMKANLSSDSADHVTVSKLAVDLGLVAKTAQNYAAEHKWYMELRDLRELVTDDVNKAMAVDQDAAIARLKADNLNEETAVRKRHLLIARTVLVKASIRLRDIDPKDLTVREALDLARLGIAEERKALGMADDIGIVIKGPENKTELSFAQADNVIGEILDLMKEEDGTYSDPNIIEVREDK